MSPQGEPSFSDRLAMALAAALPFGFAFVKVPETPPFRGDLALIRGLGLVGTLGDGGITTLSIQLASLIPLGTRSFRAASVSAIALGLSGLVIYLLCRRLLLAHLHTPRLAPLLALLAALSATLSPLLQEEGSVTGGATVALSLGLVALLVHISVKPSDSRYWLGLGAILGAVFAESAALALALLVALSITWALNRPLPKRGPWLFSGALLTTAALLHLPWLLPARPSAASLAKSAHLDIATLWKQALSSPSAFQAWPGQIGLYTLAFFAVGTALSFLRKGIRPLALPLLVAMAVGALLPQGIFGALATDPLRPIQLLSLSLLAVVASLGFQSAVTALMSTRTVMAATAAVLLVTFDLAKVVTAMEAMAYAEGSRSSQGADAFMHASFWQLPPRSVLLLRTQAIGHRLLAARIEEGARPDILLIPSRLLSEGRAARRLLEIEPELLGLLRDYSMDGRPGEASMTHLADARPLYVELDPSWDSRLASHLLADSLFLRFAPQPLGRSDRERAFENARPLFEEVLAEARGGSEAGDKATVLVLSSLLRGYAATAALLGDKDAALALLEDLSELSRDDPFITELSHRLGRRR